MTSVLFSLFAEGGEGKVEGSVSAWINPKFTHPVAVATGVESSSGEGQNVHRCTKVRPRGASLGRHRSTTQQVVVIKQTMHEGRFVYSTHSLWVSLGYGHIKIKIKLMTHQLAS